MRRGDYIMSGYMAVVCAAVGIVFWLVLAPRGGGYTNARYHFTVRYPSGWQASANDGGVPGAWPTLSAANGVTASGVQATPIPLSVTITRMGQSAAAGPTSSLTITVWDLNNPTGASQAASLATNKTLHAATIGGLAGFESTPNKLPLPGNAGSASATADTHTDFYVVHGAYEYQLSTDAISGDNSDGALAGMVASFHLTA